MKRFRFLPVLLLSALLAQAGVGARAVYADDSSPQVKSLLEEGLRLYGEKQYVRALDLFKQVQQVDPSNATAAEYIKSSQQRIQEWDSEGGGDKDKSDPTWDSLLKGKKNAAGGEGATNANDIIAARKSLVDRMRNRSTNTDNIVQIQDSKRSLDILLFHDQLFSPGLQTLRDEALPILENVAQLIREKGDKPITIRSQAHVNSSDPYLLYPPSDSTSSDPSLPNMKGGGTSMLFQDIEAIRSMILFTYLAQRSMGKVDSNPAH
jgi:hypothetical protein